MSKENIEAVITNEDIKKIIYCDLTRRQKEEALDLLGKELEIAKDIVSGKFTICHECRDYYLTESFILKEETREQKICTYYDPINSGGNDYVDGIVNITYSVCPKGHVHEIYREEKRK